MLQDVIHPPEQQLPTEGISSPLTAQILDFCDDGDIFSEALRNSEVSSCSGGGGGAGSGSAGICCYDDISLPSDFSPFSSMDASALSALLDSQPQPEPDIVLPGGYSSMQPTPPPMAAVYPAPSYLSNTPDHFDATALSNINNPMNGYSPYSSDPLLPLSAAPPQLAPPSLPSVDFDDDCMLSLSGYMGLDSSPASTSCSFMAPTMGGALYTGSMGVTPPSGEGLAYYPGSMVAVTEPVMAAQEVVVDYQGESGGCGGGMGFYAADSMTHPRIYGTTGDLQVSGEHPRLVSGCGSPTPLASDVASLDESTFKVCRLSVEERKEKIHRYMKKRNERNFTKKIKYACRKTLADSRPRVRGRFAKNDEFGDGMKPNSAHHDQDYDEEEVVIKEEEDMMDSSELCAHLSGMNSFKCNYTLESWI